MIAVNPTTNGEAILRRVLAEPVPDEVLLDKDSGTPHTREANIELRAGLAKLGVSQARFARLIGSNRRTVAHWTNDRPVGPGITLLVRAMLVGKLKVRDLERLLGG